MQGVKEIREFLLRPVENVLCEEAAAGTEFNDFDLRGRVEHAPYLLELARHQSAEDRMYIAGSVEISGLAELLRVAGIVAQFRVVKAPLHVAGKSDGTALANFLFDLLSERIHLVGLFGAWNGCGGCLGCEQIQVTDQRGYSLVEVSLALFLPMRATRCDDVTRKRPQ
jgi:hypothetical protein